MSATIAVVHSPERHRPDRDLHRARRYRVRQQRVDRCEHRRRVAYDLRLQERRHPKSSTCSTRRCSAATSPPDAIPSDDECGAFFVCFSSTKIADRAVGASEISPGAVGTSEAAPNSLTGSDVNDNSLTGSDINESTLDAFGLPGPVSLTVRHERHRADLQRLLHRGFAEVHPARHLPADREDRHLPDRPFRQRQLDRLPARRRIRFGHARCRQRRVHAGRRFRYDASNAGDPHLRVDGQRLDPVPRL